MSENTNTQVATAKPTDVVAKTITTYLSRGEIVLPKNYAFETILKQTWLKLQEVKDRSGAPVLQSCTKESVVNSLLQMVTQGLDPNKNQGYFIPYGNKLTFTPSYFGYVALALRTNPEVEEIISEVVYTGDAFEFAKKRGKNVIVNHQSKLENMKKENIIAAYCSIYYRNGDEKTEIMSFDEIKTAWNQTQMGKPVDANGNISATGTHGKFTVEMAKKTVTKRACKWLINTSNDFALLNEIMNESEFEMNTAEVKEEIKENANKEVFTPEFDEKTGEIIDVEHIEVVEEDDEDIRDLSIEEPEQINIFEPSF